MSIRDSISKFFGKREPDRSISSAFDSDPGAFAPREPTAPPIDVNQRQVGGTHYNAGAKPQHWDYVMLNLGGRYLEGNASKYVMRHKKKGTPVQDLDKALHYLEKLQVEFSKGNVIGLADEESDIVVQAIPLASFCDFHNQDEYQRAFLAGLMHWKHGADILSLVALVNMMRDNATQDAVMLNARKAGAIPYTPERRGIQPREQNLHSTYPPDRSFGQRIPDATPVAPVAPASESTTFSPDAPKHDDAWRGDGGASGGAGASASWDAPATQCEAPRDYGSVSSDASSYGSSSVDSGSSSCDTSSSPSSSD